MDGVPLGGEDKGTVEMKVQSMRRIGKYFCPNFLKPLREIFDRKNRNCHVAKIVYVALRRARPNACWPIQRHAAYIT